jgi:hypothetical protein
MYSASISPDGGQLAIQTTVCAHDAGCSEGLAVASLPSGGVRKVWLASGTEGSDMPDQPARWADGGRELVFGWQTPGAETFRVLDVSRPSEDLIAASRPLPVRLPLPIAGMDTVFPQPALTPDGRGLVVGSYVSAGYSGRASLAVVEYSLTTGRLLRVLRTVVPYAAHQNICRPLSIGPAGFHLLVQCNGFGRLDGSHFTPLPGVPSSFPPLSGTASANSPSSVLLIGDTAAW